MSSQLAYTLEPDSRLTSVTVAANKNLSQTARINFGVVQNLEPRLTTLALGYNQNFGSFGMGVSARYSSNGDIAVGMQLFMSPSAAIRAAASGLVIGNPWPQRAQCQLGPLSTAI